VNRQAIFLSIVFFLLLSLAPPALAQSDCDFSISNYARAVQLHDMGDYDRALAHYDCALLEDPDDVIIRQLIENVHEDIRNASRAWDRPRQPTCDPTRDNGELGEAAFARGDMGRARTHSHCALLLDPADVDALTLMGRIYANLGDAHTARHYLYHAEAARRQAAEQPARFKMPDWLTPYETAPRRNAVGISSANSGDAFARAPEDGRAFVLVLTARVGVQPAEAAPATREPAPAAAEYAPESTSPAQATFVRGLEFLSARKRYAAANTFLEALEIDPSHRGARCHLGAVLTEWANYSGALAQFDRLLADDPQDECARRNRKLAVTRMMAMYVPLTVDDFFFHARTYVQIEAWLLARDAFERGLERDPARKGARCELGMVYATLGEERAALREFERVLQHDAVDPCARANREGLMQRLRAEG